MEEYGFLNVVYDDWNYQTSQPLPNLQSIFGENRFRTVTGFFMFYNVLNKIRHCHIDEVRMNPDENYFYFINGINDLYNVITQHEKLVLPEKVEEIFKECKNFNLIYLNEHEYEVEGCLLLLEEIIKKYELDGSRIYMVNNNSKLNYYKEKYNLSFGVHSLDFLMQINSRNLCDFNPQLLEDKEGFFLNHNRSVSSLKSHRYCLLVYLKKMGILDSVDWSLLMGSNAKDMIINGDFSYFYKNLLTDEDLSGVEEERKFFESIDIKKSKYELEHTWFDDVNNHNGIDWGKVYEPKSYEQSYINITTESCYFFNEIHITDKTIKPLYFYQMPIFLASSGHVKYVRDRFGFDVFDDLIDHSYDNEQDNRKRFFMIMDEIKRLNDNKNEVKEFYKNNKNRLFKNRLIASQLKDSNRDMDFFFGLINKK